jgi:hypothetical protein
LRAHSATTEEVEGVIGAGRRSDGCTSTQPQMEEDHV